MELDETDRAILRILQENARTPFSEIARRIDMSSATVHDRVGRLEDAGVIEGYHAKVNPSKVGYGVSALVGLRVEQGRKDAAIDALRDVEAVRDLYLTTGEWDVIIRVVARDTDDIRDLMFDRIAEVDGFSRSQTMIILETGYEANGLPI